MGRPMCIWIQRQVNVHCLKGKPMYTETGQCSLKDRSMSRITGQIPCQQVRPIYTMIGEVARLKVRPMHTMIGQVARLKVRPMYTMIGQVARLKVRPCTQI